MALPTVAKAVALALCLAPVSFGAFAISRYQSTSMPCAGIRATILNEGAAIFRWKQPPNIDRFGRYVAHVGYCFIGEEAEVTYIPAADTNACAVLECKPEDDDFFFHRFKPRPN
jgi:hypothetical protein